MEAHVAVAHLPFNLSPGHQGGYGVHHHHIQRTGTDQVLRDFQGLFAGVRLGDQHILDVHPQGPGIGGVQGMFRVDKGHLAASLLGLGDNVQGQGGFTGGFGAIDLDDTPPGYTANPQRKVQCKGAGGDNLHIQVCLVAQAHDGALAVHLLDVLHCALDCLFFVAGNCGGFG